MVDPLILKGWLANGVLSLHLLDTRAWAADGTAAVADDDAHASRPVSGAAAKGAVIELRVPRDPNATSQFFRVGRNPLN